MGEIEDNITDVGRPHWNKFQKLLEKKEGNYADSATKCEDAVFLNGEKALSWHIEAFNSGDKIRILRNMYRDTFMLDRDRILYSKAFKRLAGKTQLFAPEKNIVENRLTHTLNVAQLTRSICSGLYLNETLGEAIAYGHDIGHPPFGHSGESSIQEWVAKKMELGGYIDSGQARLQVEGEVGCLNLTKDEETSSKIVKYFVFGNDPCENFFMHGRQSFKILTFFDKERTGKLTRQTLFGIWRHSRDNIETDNDFKFPICEFYHPYTRKHFDVELSCQDLSLEAQVVRFADDIAWIVTGLEEGIREEMIDPRDIRRIFREKMEAKEDLPKDQRDLLGYIDDEEYIKLYTYFVSNIIRENEGHIQNPTTKTLVLSENVLKSLEILKDDVVDVKLHKSFDVSRGDYISHNILKSLCEWFFKFPNDLEKVFNQFKTKPDFPLSKVEWNNEIKEDKIRLMAFILDFISVLTDHEVREISYAYPLKV